MFMSKYDRSRAVPICKRHIVREKTFEFLDQISFSRMDCKINHLSDFRVLLNIKFNLIFNILINLKSNQICFFFVGRL